MNDINLLLFAGLTAGHATFAAVDEPWLYDRTGANATEPPESTLSLYEINPYGPRATDYVLEDEANADAWLRSTAAVDPHEHR